MNTLIALIMSIALFNPVRPAPLDPNDVPFTYDPNQCNYELLKWYIVEQNKPLVMERIVFERDGEDVTLSLASSDGSTDIFIEQRSKETDEVGTIKYIFYMDWRPKVRDDLGIFYLDVIATDPKGAYDARTLLVNVIKPNNPPVIMK